MSTSKSFSDNSYTTNLNIMRPLHTTALCSYELQLFIYIYMMTNLNIDDFIPTSSEQPLCINVKSKKRTILNLHGFHKCLISPNLIGVKIIRSKCLQ